MPSALDNTVYFDARYIRIGHHDGISRFSVGLIWALHRRTRLRVIVSDLRQLEKLPPGISYVLLSDPASWKEFFIAGKLNALGARLVYSPMQTMGTMGRRYKLVLTLHDLIYYSHPKPPPQLPWWIRLGWRLFHLSYIPQRLTLNRADAIVTVSQTTKRQMLRHRLTFRPIQVVYNAAGNLSHDYQHQLPSKQPAEPKRLIYMGSFMDYKNVELLAKATNLLAEYELHLLSPITPKRIDQLRSLGDPERMVFHDGVSESRYHELLDGAFALVTASKDEGFGIPLVEAMARGIPVVVSDIEIFREIGAESACYFDPERVEEFARAVRSLENPVTWLQFSEKSSLRAKHFSWDSSASALLEILRTAERGGS